MRNGGRLFTELRAGWVDKRADAQAVVPGYGWDEAAPFAEAIPARQIREITTGAFTEGTGT